MVVDLAVTHNGRTSAYKDRYDLARTVARNFTCAGCGGRGYTFQVVQGSFNEAVKCGAKCRSAVGPRCECQCSGRHHGETHSAI